MDIQGVFNIPFAEMRKYIAGKRRVLPTKTWRDIQQSAHAKAFVIAGVSKMDFLIDVLGILKEQSENGVNYSDFRKQFREKVAAHGWTKFQDETRSYQAWRTQIIFNTNVRTAYAAGRWEQMNSETSAENFPYLVYRHSFYGKPKNPREEHLAFDGIVLPKNHNFWKEFYPNGKFGCNCGVEQLTTKEAEREMKKSGKGETIEAVETHIKTLGAEMKKHRDSGWAYNVGMDDSVGIKSLIERTQKIIASDKYSPHQKEVAEMTLKEISEKYPEFV